MGRPAVAIALSVPERRELESLARAQKTGQSMARRARIVLAAASGMDNKTICREVGAQANTVGKWRRRFAAHRLDGLLDEPRPGTPRRIGDEAIAETIRRTLESVPAGSTHWSLRTMAKAVGYAPSTIHRIWRAFGLQPHRSETFKLSNDPLFVEKVRDIVGLYMAPLERALVLCVDEKSQIQALGRAALQPRHAGRRGGEIRHFAGQVPRRAPHPGPPRVRLGGGRLMVDDKNIIATASRGLRARASLRHRRTAAA